MNSAKPIVLFGVGSEYAYEAMEMARRAGLEVAAYIDNLGSAERSDYLNPMLMGGAAFVCFAIPGVLAILGYTGSVVLSLILRKSR